MIAAKRERHATIAPREIAHLRLPRAPVAGELVHENDWRAAADFFVVQAHVVTGRGEGHGRSPAVGAFPGKVDTGFPIGNATNLESRALSGYAACDFMINLTGKCSSLPNRQATRSVVNSDRPHKIRR